MVKQVKFKITDVFIGDPNEILGGIAIFDDNDCLVKVICGCCGGVLEPEDVEIIHVYENWVDLVDTILGSDEGDE